MSNKDQGLGILDSEDWDKLKGDWDHEKLEQMRWLSPPPDIETSKSSVSRAFKRWLFLVWPRPTSRECPQLRPTAWLDGLRGFAALVVYWHHQQLWVHDERQKEILETAFGYQGQYHMATFPGIRLFFSGGHIAVSIFFVISGYVLSVKPLSLAHSGEQTRLAENISSALFRRWLRLYIPVFATTFLYAVSWHAFGGIWVDAEKQGNLRDEIWNWYCQLKNFSNVFNTGGDPWLVYNFHLWSIPTEMKGSILIWTSILAFSRALRSARVWCTIGVIFYFMYITDGAHWCFFAVGMLLADLDILASKQQLPAMLAYFARHKTFIYYHLFALGVYLAGVPSHSKDVSDLRKQRGWHYLSYLTPQAVFDYKWFYLFWAASLIVASTPRISWLKRFLETGFCQYLGRISFAFYLVHGPILETLGDRLYSAVGLARAEQIENIPWWVNKFRLPNAGPLGMEVNFLLVNLVLLPVTIWIGDLVTKLVDEPTVKFTQWLYRRTLPFAPETMATKKIDA